MTPMWHSHRPMIDPNAWAATAPFKRDVRKHKELGLTGSLPVGYRLSPRGAAWLTPP